MELKLSSLGMSAASRIGANRGLAGWLYQPEITVRTAYDLKPCCASQQNAHTPAMEWHTSMMTSITLIVSAVVAREVQMPWSALLNAGRRCQTTGGVGRRRAPK